jgi:flagellar protein FliO/FliZ
VLCRLYQFVGLISVSLLSNSSYANTLGSNPVNPGITLLKMTVAMVVVLGSIWGLSALLRRMRVPSLQARNGMSLISSFNVGQREKLIVVQVGDEQLLLGVTSSQITKLHVLANPLDLNGGSGSQSFKETLNAAMNREIPA